MRHPGEQDLILLHYGDHADAEAVRGHMADCARCREEYAALERFLEALEPLPVPERDPGYGERVFRRVVAQAQAPGRSAWPAWLAWPRLALASAVAVLLLAAFWIGREQGQSEAALTAEQRQRILLLAVSEHLARSERMLLDLANASPAATLDLGGKPAAAGRLAADNRMYRATAHHAGLEPLAVLLDDLERILVDIANSPATVSGPELYALWRRIEASGLLIKLRIAEGQSLRDARIRPAAATQI